MTNYKYQLESIVGKNEANKRETFWDFSVRTYKCDGIAAICLSLQNRYGVDVNQLFFSCWYGFMYGEFSEETFTTVIEFSDEWASNIVIPLREVRTWMKPAVINDDRIPTEAGDKLREQIKKVELESEKLQEQILESLVITQPMEDLNENQKKEAATKNIIRYLKELDIELNDLLNSDINRILSAGISVESIA